MYFVMIRPQQQRIRAQQQAIRTVQVGDEVVTAAGLIGTIVALDDEVVNLEVADGVEVRVARMAIGRRLNETEVVNEPTDLDDEDNDLDDDAVLELEASAEDGPDEPDGSANGDHPGAQGER